MKINIAWLQIKDRPWLQSMMEWNFRSQYIERSSLDTLHFHIVDLFRPMHIHHTIPHVSNTTGNQHFRNQPWLSKYSIVSTMHLPCNFYLIESCAFLRVDILKLNIPYIWYIKWFEFQQKLYRSNNYTNKLINFFEICLFRNIDTDQIYCIY